LKLGLKGYRSKFDNDILVKDYANDQFTKNERFSQDYSLEENIGAAYTSLDFQLGDNTSLIAGLRYEYTDYLLSTQLDPQFLDLKFGNLFPSIFIAHNLKNRQQLQFSYSRRITRPAFDELAPFVTFIDQNTFFSGNPSLVPGITDNLRMSYRWRNISLTGTYGFTENAIFKYQPVVDPNSNTQIYTTLNIDKDHQAGIRIAVPLTLAKWWETHNVFDWGWNRLIINGENQQSRQDIKAYVVSSTHNFSLSNKWTFELTGVYQSSAFYGLLRVRPKGTLNLGIRKVLPNGRGTLSLSATDLLRTNVWRSTTLIPELNLNNTSTFDVETRIIRLTYSATFGSAKVKKARKRTTSSAEQSRRF
jgi:outer membrane receptor protein involved in Fe transport